MLQQDLRNKTVLDRNRARGRPGLNAEAACAALITVAGQSLGSAPEEMKLAGIGKMEDIAQKKLPRDPNNIALREYEWVAVLKPATQGWAGPLWIRFGS